MENAFSHLHTPFVALTVEASEKQSFLKCGGCRVSTRQLEELMLEFQASQEVPVIGMEDDVLGEAVKTFVVPRESDFPDLENRLLPHCRERMPQEFVPKQIVVWQALRKNRRGKVRKEALKDLNVPVSAGAEPLPVP